MKTSIALCAAMFAMLVVGFVNAGSGPRLAGSTSGCASQQMYSLSPVASGGSCSQTLVAPAFKSSCGCAGQRITLSERSTARRAAKANYNKTFAACLAAAEKGELEVVEGSELQTMEMTPVEAVEEVCEGDCGCKGECGKDGCSCPSTIVVEEESPRRGLLRR